MICSGGDGSVFFVYFVVQTLLGPRSCPFVSIHVHSCPFVILPLPPPSCFFVLFVLFVVQTLLGLRFCIFVSIRVHSWFSPFPFLHVFRGSNTAWTTFLHIRVHSCPFVVLPPSPSFMFFVVQTLLGLCFCPFVSIRVHSWFSLFTLLRVFSCFSCFSWFDSPFSLLPTCPIFSLFNEIDVK